MAMITRDVVAQLAPVRLELAEAPGALTGPVQVATHVGVLTVGRAVLTVRVNNNPGDIVVIAAL
jgi:hypothetical protein